MFNSIIRFAQKKVNIFCFKYFWYYDIIMQSFKCTNGGAFSMNIAKRILAVFLTLTMAVTLFTFSTGAIESQQEWIEKNREKVGNI